MNGPGVKERELDEEITALFREMLAEHPAESIGGWHEQMRELLERIEKRAGSYES